MTLLYLQQTHELGHNISREIVFKTIENQPLLWPKAQKLQINSNNDFENELVKNRLKDSYTVKLRGFGDPSFKF